MFLFVPCRPFSLELSGGASHFKYAQFCPIQGNTTTYFIANHPSMRHPPHLLISITCLRCPHIIFPSHTGCRLNRSICTSMDLSHLLAEQKLDFRVPSGNSSIFGNQRNCVLAVLLGSVLILAINLSRCSNHKSRATCRFGLLFPSSAR